MASSFSRNVPLIETVAIDLRMTCFSKDPAPAFLVLDLRYCAQLVGRGRPETEEFQVRRNLLEQHVGAHLDRTAPGLCRAQERSHLLLHHHFTYERGRGDTGNVDRRRIALHAPAICTVDVTSSSNATVVTLCGIVTSAPRMLVSWNSAFNTCA